MSPVLVALVAALRACCRRRAELEVEILALRHQLAVLQRDATRRPRLGRADQLLYAAVELLAALATIDPHRQARHGRAVASPAFAGYWRWKSQPRRDGRPAVAQDVCALIRHMSHANPLWGAPRIYGELLKLVSLLETRYPLR